MSLLCGVCGVGGGWVRRLAADYDFALILVRRSGDGLLGL